MLFICANLVALLVSGTVAGVSAHYLRYNPIGLAITTAMQMLVISALILRWMRCVHNFTASVFLFQTPPLTALNSLLYNKNNAGLSNFCNGSLNNDRRGLTT